MTVPVSTSLLIKVSRRAATSHRNATWRQRSRRKNRFSPAGSFSLDIRYVIAVSIQLDIDDAASVAGRKVGKRVKARCRRFSHLDGAFARLYRNTP